MNNFTNQPVNVPMRSPDDLVLEDTIEATETIVGHGQANIFKAPDEKIATVDTGDTKKLNKRAHKQNLLSDRDVSLKEAGNINASFKEKQVTDCRQSKEKSKVVPSARQIEEAPYTRWKGRQTEISVQGNVRELSLPPIFVNKISQNQEQSNSVSHSFKNDFQSPSIYEKKSEKLNERQDENVTVEDKVSEQSLVSSVDKPSVAGKANVNLRMKLEQIKQAVKLDRKRIPETTSVKRSSEAEKAEETTETTESEISDVEASHSTNKDFLQVKKLHSVQHFQPLPLQLEVAKDLKKLVLGSSSLTFRDEWKFQGFSFADHPKLQYGIIQKKSGPCGIFSVVQAFLLRHLLFIENLKLFSHSLEQPCLWEKAGALAAALADILWQAGQQKKAVIAILGKKTHLNPSCIRTDGITEKVLVITLDRYEDLLCFLTQNIDQYSCVSGPGLILSVYSVILSHTIQRVHDNMDDANGRLIEGNGCSSQELLNLFLTGNAVTNFFNNDQVSIDADGNRMIKKGIVSRSEVGLLSASECQKSSFEVGTYLKTPKYPIWLLQIENNFSVFFSPKKAILSDWKAEKKFDIYYYNCFNKQNDEIKLTIDNLNAFYCPPPEEDVISPVELCIRTKWNKAEIHWNGIEPLI